MVSIGLPRTSRGGVSTFFISLAILEVHHRAVACTMVQNGRQRRPSPLSQSLLPSSPYRVRRNQGTLEPPKSAADHAIKPAYLENPAVSCIWLRMVLPHHVGSPCNSAQPCIGFAKPNHRHSPWCQQHRLVSPRHLRGPVPIPAEVVLNAFHSIVLHAEPHSRLPV